MPIDSAPAIAPRWLPDQLDWFHLLFAALSVALLAVVSTLIARWLFHRLFPMLSLADRGLYRIRDRALQRWPESRLGWLRAMLSGRPAEPGLLLVAGLVLWATIAIVLAFAEEVMEPGTLVNVDFAVYQLLQGLRTDAFDVVMVMITDLGGAWVTVPIMITVAAWLAWRRQWAALAYWLGAALAARLSVVLLKSLLARERPGSIYVGVENFSFPSGHATTGMILYGFLAFLLGSGQRTTVKLAIYAAAAVLIAAIGLSRLYLGVHWLSDVGAGFSLGFAWVTLLALAFARLHPHQRPAAAPLVAIVGLTLIAAAGYQYIWHLPTTVERYQAAQVVPN